MADSNIGIGGTDVLVPEEQLGKISVSVQDFDLGEGPVSTTLVAIGAEVSNVETKIQGGDNLAFAGKALIDSNVIIKQPKAVPFDGAQARDEATTSIVRFENQLNEEVDVKAKKGNAVDLKIAEGKFRRSSYRGAKGQQDDSVLVGSSAKLINATFNLRKGDDTFEIVGGATLKGTNTVDLGKGADKVIVGNEIKGKGKLVIKNMDKKDRLSYNGEEFTLKQIQNGDADLPGFLELG